MLLSIIIPVYNVEEYVGGTLDSVFNSTAPAEDFEVIVVNDGTKDGSMDVVRQFSERPNLTVIEQENQGLSAARMKGLSEARGGSMCGLWTAMTVWWRTVSDRC